MNLEQAIKNRRSIRKYTPETVTMEDIRKIITAATYAPSGHNIQPWRFTVLTGEEKDKVIHIIESTLQWKAEKHGATIMGSSLRSCSIMEQAPVLILVWNTRETFTATSNKETQRKLTQVMPDAKRLGLMVGVQGVSAAIQNMLLMAHGMGLGSLWVNDLYYAIDELTEYFDNGWNLVAGVSIGHPDPSEAQKKAPRKLSVDEVTEFRHGNPGGKEF